MTTVDYTVVVGDTECTTGCTIVELSETASLADARTEVELDAVEIQEIPRDFLFLYKGIKCPQRKEQTRKVADATGAEARLYIVPVTAAPVKASAVRKAAATVSEATAPVVQDAGGGAVAVPAASSDITIEHCASDLADRIKTSFATLGYNASETVGGKLVVAIVTDDYLGSAECLDRLRAAKTAGTPLQPVVRATDKLRIGELIGKSPPELELGNIDWVHLNDKDDGIWDAGIQKIVKKLGTQKAIKCNQPGEWDIFLGHSRRSKDATTIAATLDKSFKAKDYAPWLDVNMDDKSEAAMEEGVKHSKLVIAIVTGPCINNDKPNEDPETNAYFKRKFCLQELRWAMEAGIPIQPVIRTEDAERKDEFMKLAPAEFQFLGDLRDTDDQEAQATDAASRLAEITQAHRAVETVHHADALGIDQKHASIKVGRAAAMVQKAREAVMARISQTSEERCVRMGYHRRYACR